MIGTLTAGALLSSGLLMGSHLVIVMDDVGWTGVRSYAERLPVDVRSPATPNIDSHAQQGVRFTRAYVNPVCSPTRAALLTGRHAFRTGAGAVLFPDSEGGPTDGETWLAEALEPTHAAGLFGKWHLGTSENGFLLSPLDPEAGGVGHFDVHRGTFGNLGIVEDYFNWFRVDSGAVTAVGHPGGPFTRDPLDYHTTVVVDDAVDWIDAQAGDWLAVVSFAAGHRPYHVPPTADERAAVGLPPLMRAETEAALTAFVEGDQAALDALGWGDVQAVQPAFLAAYIGMVEAMDTEIGRLVEETGIDLDPVTGDTTLWILGDNGPDFKIVEFDQLDPAHAKGSPYELSIRVPLIARGRGVSDVGETCGRIVQHVDVYSSILAMEGVASGDVDGVDVSSYLRNVRSAPRRNLAYSEVFVPTGPIVDPLSPAITGWNRSIQSEDYKLVTILPMGPLGPVRHELYHLATDPMEKIDLAAGGAAFVQPHGLQRSAVHLKAMKHLMFEQASLLLGP